MSRGAAEENADSLRDLSSLFEPRRVGILGYSAKPGRWGRRLVDTAANGGYAGELVAIRPRSAVSDIASSDDMAGLDLLVIVVAAEEVPAAVAEARDAGVGAAVIISAGFAESGEAGRALQDRVRDAAGSMPVLGPNCVGLVSGPSKLRLTVRRPRRSTSARAKHSY